MNIKTIRPIYVQSSLLTNGSDNLIEIFPQLHLNTPTLNVHLKPSKESVLLLIVCGITSKKKRLKRVAKEEENIITEIQLRYKLAAVTMCVK